MTETGNVTINAVGALFFILAAVVSRYTPRHGSDLSEFWTGFGPTMYTGALYALIRTTHRMGIIPELTALLELVMAVVTAAVFMVLGIVWAVTASRRERIKDSWSASKDDKQPEHE